MLNIELILRQGNQKVKFGYTDDIAILQTDSMLTKFIRKLEAEARLLLEWGKKNAIFIDLEKSELQNFTRSRKTNDYPGLTIDRTHITTNQVTRWLGVWLDRKPTFLHLTRHWSAKGMTIVAHLRRVNSTVKGSPPYLLK